MLSKGNLTTLRRLNKIVTNKDYILVGLNYDSDLLEQFIPVTTVIDNLIIDTKKDTMAGCLSFRPVGDSQLNALSLLKDISERFGYGEFLDESIDKPVLNSSFKANVLLPDTAFSNIQEIPFNFYFVEPEVFMESVTIKGRKHIQYTVVDNVGNTDEPVSQRLTMLFRKSEYDGETLLGAYSKEKLNKTDTIKLLQFIGNGSLLEQVVGAVTVSSNKVTSTLIPLFNDVSVEFVQSNNQNAMVSIMADTGAVTFSEQDLKGMYIESPSFGSYRIVLTVGKDTISLLIG